MRFSMPFRSINKLAGFLAVSLLFLFAGFWGSSSLAIASSSFSFTKGDMVLFCNVTRYIELVLRMSILLWSNQLTTGPASVEAKKKRYLPLRSNTGSLASLRPSVTGYDFCLSSEYRYTLLNWLEVTFV